MALEETGMTTDFLIDEVLGTEAILDDLLHPYCRQWKICEPGVSFCENFASCTAYNGDSAADVLIGKTPPIDPLVDKAIRNTSAAIESGLEAYNHSNLGCD